MKVWSNWMPVRTANRLRLFAIGLLFPPIAVVELLHHGSGAVPGLVVLALTCWAACRGWWLR